MPGLPAGAILKFVTDRLPSWPSTPKTLAAVAATVGAIIVTIVIYAPGLHGPFLLDDIGNLEPLKRWLDGELSWRSVAFDNRSGPGGRPLSMMSFMLDALRAGNLDSFTFKGTNLAIHILTGAAVFALARVILYRTSAQTFSVTKWAGFIALAWLWMPIQLSTVLYVVQRMAQLSALFTFLALLLYLHARINVIAGRLSGHLVLWIGVPAVTLIAALTKENGVLALPLAAAVEFTLFEPSTRTRSIKIFFLVTVLAPLIAGTIFLSLRPDWVMRGYAIRDFTLGERLMTEPRILWSYLQTSFFPVGPRMGIYHDNYPISRNLGSPATTAIALFAWLAAVFSAYILRKRMPIFSLGVLGYLIGLSLESGPISLELYFEHRNYGPVFFALLALIGLLIPALTSAHVRPEVRRITLYSSGVILFAYAFGTWNQAHAWADEQTFYAVQYGYNPTSPRLLSALTGRAMMNKDLSASLRLIAEGEHYEPGAEAATSTLWRFLAYCETSDAPSVPVSLYDELAGRATGRVTNYAMVAWDLLASRSSRGCGNLDRLRLAQTGEAWLTASSQKKTEQAMWRTRFNVGKIYADGGATEHARSLIKDAWEESAQNNGIGVVLFQLNASLGDVKGCQQVLDVLSRIPAGGDLRLDLAVREFRDALKKGQIGAPR